VIQFELEEDIFWNKDTGKFDWVYGQQTEYHIVDPSKRAQSTGAELIVENGSREGKTAWWAGWIAEWGLAILKWE
jgi:hypothetical protein